MRLRVLKIYGLLFRLLTFKAKFQCYLMMTVIVFEAGSLLALSLWSVIIT